MCGSEMKPDTLSSVVQSIEDSIRLGVLSFRQIAVMNGIPLSLVNRVWDQMCETELAGDEQTIYLRKI
jgi:hypothetical protein